MGSDRRTIDLDQLFQKKKYHGRVASECYFLFFVSGADLGAAMDRILFSFRQLERDSLDRKNPQYFRVNPVRVVKWGTGYADSDVIETEPKIMYVIPVVVSGSAMEKVTFFNDLSNDACDGEIICKLKLNESVFY